MAPTGKSIQDLRREQSALSLLPCEECGRPHVRNGKPTCKHHTEDEEGALWPCANFPLANRDICWFHGGRTPVGPANRFWKHGAYSKHLPLRYKHAFELSLTDPELTSVKYQIALLDAREAELVKRLDTAEAGVLWSEVQAAAMTLKRAMEQTDKPALQQAVANELLNKVETWSNNEVQWNELYAIFEMRRKLADTERRREEGLNAHITLDEMTKLAHFIAGMLRRYVPDNKALRSASAELSQFFGLFQQPVIEAEVVASGEEKQVAPAEDTPPMPKQADTLNGAVMNMMPLIKETPKKVRKARKTKKAKKGVARNAKSKRATRK